jgi:Glycosyl transferase family 2
MTATDGVVTVCIPAYQAAGFIDRTLRCARGQTYARQRILVSVDQCDDATEEICRDHARDDDRVAVHAHPERLGWLRNVNFLLDAVDTELAFVYFHDDIVEPTYTEHLVAALRDRPDAASAHCDVVLDRPGGVALRRGCAYDGTAAERLLTYFLDADRGALLRSMVRRSSPAGALRMTAAAAVYEMQLVAAGPAVHVAEPLYRRFAERAGGLTQSWARRPFDEFLTGLRGNAARAAELVAALDPSPTERALLDLGLAIYVTNRLRWIERAYGTTGVVPLERLLDRAVELRVPTDTDLPPRLREQCVAAIRRTEQRTAERTQRVDQPAR